MKILYLTMPLTIMPMNSCIVEGNHGAAEDVTDASVTSTRQFVSISALDIEPQDGSH